MHLCSCRFHEGGAGSRRLYYHRYREYNLQDAALEADPDLVLVDALGQLQALSEGAASAFPHQVAASLLLALFLN